MSKPELLIFASGTADDGGSGFANLVRKRIAGELDANIVGVVSNHEHGGVRKYADELGIDFTHFPAPWTAERYLEIAESRGAEFFALSGWLKFVRGLDPRHTFNIHPGLLPHTAGLHGAHVHESIVESTPDFTEVCMHFVTTHEGAKYDEGPIFFRRSVKVEQSDTPDTLGKRVNAVEHMWQPRITNLVVHRQIRWDGKDPASLVVPRDYSHLVSDTPY